METPREALERFIAEVEGAQSLFKPLHARPDDALDAGAAALRPFLANPDRYDHAVRIVLQGIVTNATFSAFSQTIPALRSRWFPRLASFLGAGFTGKFDELKRDYLSKLASVRADLLRSPTPGRLEIDILPPKVKDAPGYRLLEFQVNIDISPASDFAAEALTVRLQSPDVQFSTVSPSTRVESVGSYEDTDTTSGKESYARKGATKINFEAGVAAVGAKVSTEMTDEETDGYEYQLTKARKVSGQRFGPLVIGSAMKGVAYWQLLAEPQQPLLGGLPFFATAYAPIHITRVTLTAEVEARLAGFGDHRVTETREIDLLPGRPASS